MEQCKNCIYYKETYTGKGICTLYDTYVTEKDWCEDWV